LASKGPTWQPCVQRSLRQAISALCLLLFSVFRIHHFCVSLLPFLTTSIQSLLLAARGLRCLLLILAKASFEKIRFTAPGKPVNEHKIMTERLRTSLAETWER